jgi:hypothetical protein
MPRFFEQIYCNVWKKRWLVRNNNISYFDFKVAKLPDVSGEWKMFRPLPFVYEDTFLLPILFMRITGRKSCLSGRR